MIIYEGPGSLFTSRCQTILCPINTMGTMGAGLAATFAEVVPGLEQYYRKFYSLRGRDPTVTGNLLKVYTVDAERKVLLFPTKYDWREPSVPELIRQNLETVAISYQSLGLETLAIPKLGCGLGQLDWAKQVRPLVYEHLQRIDLPVKIIL